MPSDDFGHRVHVLYIDDSADDRWLLERVARSEKSSISVFCVDNFPVARAYLSGEGPFADRQQYPVPVFVLLDYALNGHSGADILRWIRNHGTLKDLPVVMYSDSDDAERRSICYREGANHYLRKANSLPRLMDVMKILHQCFASDPPCHDLLLTLPEYRPPP